MLKRLTFEVGPSEKLNAAEAAELKQFIDANFRNGLFFTMDTEEATVSL